MIVAVRQANAVRYFKLDPSQSLVLQLAQKAVIEFPVLLVLLPDEVQIFHSSRHGDTQSQIKYSDTLQRQSFGRYHPTGR